MLYRFVLLFIVAMPLVGCSHASYSRTWDTDRLEGNDHRSPIVDGYELEHGSNNILLLDRTGAVCASIGSSAEGLANATKARSEAEKKGDTTYTYEYRRHSPAEYAGVECGAFYRFGRGGGTFASQESTTDFMPPPGFQPQDYDVETRSTEAAFHIGTTQPFFERAWIRYTFNWRLGLGRYKVLNIEDFPNGGFPENIMDVDDDKFFFRSPFLFGLKLYPRFLFGFGVEGDVAFDPLMPTFAKRWGKFYTHFDFAARAGYYLPIGPVAIGLFGGVERRNISWGDYIVRTNNWGVGASFDINFAEL